MSEKKKSKIAAISNSYFSHFLTYEWIIPFFILVILFESLNSCYKPFETFLQSSLTFNKTLYPIIAQISGTLLGFVITAVSIIISLLDKPIFKEFRTKRPASYLYKVYFSSIIWLGINTVMSVVSIFISGYYGQFLFFIVVYGSTVASLRIYRTIWILSNIVEIVREGYSRPE